MSSRSIGDLSRRFLVAIVAVVLALLVRLALAPYGNLPRYTPFYPFVLLAAMVGGIWAGLLTTGLSAVAAVYWLLSPVGNFTVESPDVIGLVFFCTTGICVSVIAELYNRKRERLAAANAQLLSEVAERTQSEQDQNLMLDVLRILNRGGDVHALIGEVLGMVKTSTGLDAVGLRLQQGGDFPYFQQHGFSDAFVKEETFLCAKGPDGAPLRDSEGDPALECTCGLVLSGRTDPTLPIFTEGGSFWTNHSPELLSLSPEADPRLNPRNRCIYAGFESVALAPVRSGDKIIGLLQLNDRRPGRFTPDRMRFFELLANNLGLALQRRQVEEALRESESRLRTFFDTVAVGTAELDESGYFLKVNERLCRITGYSREEMLGMTPADLMHPEDRDRDKERLLEHLRGNLPTYEIEMRCVRKDGSVVWVQVTAAMILSSEGKLLRSARIIQDITERKLAEQALIRSEKLASVGRMAATIAHEVNNPLAGAINAVYIARSDPTVSEEIHKTLQLADQELRRAALITQQTLGFYRETAHKAPVALSTLIDEVLGIYARKLKERRVAVQCRYNCGPCVEGCDKCLLVDPGEMRQIISNLLANGIDALRDEGRLYIRVSRVTSLDGCSQNLHLTIADNGCGIRAENLKRVFEPFFTTKESVGTGLGLWITQELVRKHNGSIKVRSSKDKGTVFRISMPATPVANSGSAKISKSARVTTRILPAAS